MLYTILEEVVNGWVLTIYGKDGKQVSIYERYYDANHARASAEADHQRDSLKRKVGYDSIA